MTKTQWNVAIYYEMKSNKDGKLKKRQTCNWDKDFPGDKNSTQTIKALY